MIKVIGPETNLTGKKVRCDYHPYEFACPKCGRVGGTSPGVPKSFDTTILAKVKWVSCKGCETTIIPVEGFWLTDLNVSGWQLSVPYTLLSFKEDSQ